MEDERTHQPDTTSPLTWIFQKASHFSVDNIAAHTGIKKRTHCIFKPCGERSTPGISTEDLFQLIDDGNTSELDRWLGLHPELLEVRNDAGKTLLHHAAENGHTVAVDVLYQHGCGKTEKKHIFNISSYLIFLHI
ncbi:hypothetical protein BV898_19994 [Hypsibius exemplaris]|uniref:ANK_REP_REGION domain-containing protein n=1 Tax=Hypsibius exemplaris TaxID=2072580 RepID=A0A9X6NKN0_HYPEX|nr:hypothetical protein BV898_19994 [Hypsibius exemplaris]